MPTHNILIVEDDPIFALDLQDLVWEAGGTPVGPARELQGALELASRYPIDLAVIDVNLADGRTGPALARLLADQFAVRTVLVSSEPLGPEELKDRPYVFVQKPVPASILTDILAPPRRAVGRRKERVYA